MGTALVYLVVMVAVGGVLFLAASFVFGRGEQMAPLPAGYTAAVLPENKVTGADVRALKFQQVVRGYKASEVDWALDQLAAQIDELRSRLGEEPEGGADVPAPDVPAPDVPAPDEAGRDAPAAPVDSP
jgi:DivIVA domain-containing protein